MICVLFVEANVKLCLPLISFRLKEPGLETQRKKIKGNEEALNSILKTAVNTLAPVIGMAVEEEKIFRLAKQRLTFWKKYQAVKL